MKPYLSWSQISMFGICSYRWFLRYVMGYKMPPPRVLMIQGTGTHASVEQNMLSIIGKGEPITLEEVKDIARDTVTRAWQEGVSLTEAEKREGNKVVLAKTVDSAISLGCLHHASVAPNIKPAHSERRWKVELTGFPYDLMGITDIQETPEANNRVIDVKTTGKAPNKARIKSGQLTMYSLATKVLDGLDEYPPVSLDFLINKKVPEPLRLNGERTEEDVKRLLRRVEAISEAITKEIFLPANEDDWSCSEEWCGFFNICEYSTRGERPTT